jgi:hypothetical protein
MPSNTATVPPVTLTVIPALRAAGIKVRVQHHRYCYRAGYHSLVVRQRRRDRVVKDLILTSWCPKGGSTKVDLLFPDNTSFSGVAMCSTEDRFNRREGIRIALNRALAARKEALALARASAAPSQ